MICEKISNAASGWNAGYQHHVNNSVLVCSLAQGATHHLMSSLEDASTQRSSTVSSSYDKHHHWTYAKVKLSTFWIAATAFPPIVMFVNGVLCSVSLPYQSMASTDAWPPSQLQLESRPSATGNHHRAERVTPLT